MFNRQNDHCPLGFRRQQISVSVVKENLLHNKSLAYMQHLHSPFLIGEKDSNRAIEMQLAGILTYRHLICSSISSGILASNSISSKCDKSPIAI